MLSNGIKTPSQIVGARESGIELFRIITMLVIVAHHYVVNSGLTTVDYIYGESSITWNAMFLLLFGWGGKTGINCFVLITGYFMCTSKITLKKFLKLILWIELYKVIFYLIFALSGYADFGIKDTIKYLLPITSVGTGFGSAYLVFYLFIPFINILINGMSKKQHLILMGLCVGVYSCLATLTIPVTFNYVTWFTIIYVIGAYLRKYPEQWFDSKKLWGWLTLASLALSWASVIAGRVLDVTVGLRLEYFFVSDSNKPLALITAICAFMYFKNLNIGHRKFINSVAASAFGVLLIHANSDTMRQWLWKDTLNNVEMYNSIWLPVHAIASVVGIYIICTVIDMIRIRMFEKPLFRYLEKKKIL